MREMDHSVLEAPPLAVSKDEIELAWHRQTNYKQQLVRNLFVIFDFQKASLRGADQDASGHN